MTPRTSDNWPNFIVPILLVAFCTGFMVTVRKRVEWRHCSITFAGGMSGALIVGPNFVERYPDAYYYDISCPLD